MSAHEALKIDLIALENEVSAYEEQLRQLKLERAVLSVQKTTATSSGKTVTELTNLNDMLFSVTESDNVDLQNLHLENVHRLTGITAFQIRKHQGFGIRFEMFHDNQSFDTPHYIIFKSESKGKLSLYKHTLPAFVPLKSLARQYLNTDLLLFVCRVRSALYQHVFKQHMFLSGLPGVANIQVDPAFDLVKLILVDDKGMIMLVCNQTHVEKALLESAESRRWLNSLIGPLDTFPKRLLEFVGSDEADQTVRAPESILVDHHENTRDNNVDNMDNSYSNSEERAHTSGQSSILHSDQNETQNSDIDATGDSDLEPEPEPQQQSQSDINEDNEDMSFSD